MKFLCIGNCAYDITFPLEDYPEENLKYKCKKVIECSGGTANNAACLLSKWGCESYLVSIIGNDLYGKKILNELDKFRVNTKYIQISDTYNTIVSNIIVNKKNASRTIISYDTNNQEIENINIDIVPDIILIDGSRPKISKEIISKYNTALKVIDAQSINDNVIDLCSICDYVVCSKHFMEVVSNTKLDDVSNLDIAFTCLENKFKTKIVVTLESVGSAYRNELGNIVIVPSISVESVDTTGAGDIFHGSFIYGLSLGWDMYKILRFSNIAGALSTTRYGGKNSIFSLEEVESAYNEFR